MADVDIQVNTVFGFAYVNSVLSELYPISLPGLDEITARLAMLEDRIRKLEEQ